MIKKTQYKKNQPFSRKNINLLQRFCKHLVNRFEHVQYLICCYRHWNLNFLNKNVSQNKILNKLISDLMSLFAQGKNCQFFRSFLISQLKWIK